VGGRLVPELLERGYRVRCIAREPRKLEARVSRSDPRVEVIQSDLTVAVELANAIRGCSAAFYLIHSMVASGLITREGEIQTRWSAAGPIPGDPDWAGARSLSIKGRSISTRTHRPFLLPSAVLGAVTDGMLGTSCGGSAAGWTNSLEVPDFDAADAIPRKWNSAKPSTAGALSALSEASRFCFTLK
jgi:hypothetical protein